MLFPGQVSIGPFRLESCRMHLQHVCTSIYNIICIYIQCIYIQYIYIYMTNLKSVYNDGLFEYFTMQRLFLGSFCPAPAPAPRALATTGAALQMGSQERRLDPEQCRAATSCHKLHTKHKLLYTKL